MFSSRRRNRSAALLCSLLFLPLSAAAQLWGLSNASVAEGDAGTQSMVFQVTLQEPMPTTQWVYFTIETGGTATATVGQDYAYSGPVELQFAAGETQKEVAVAIVGDLVVENDEYFIAYLNDGTGGAAHVVRGDIFNDDVAPGTTYGAIDDRFVIAENTGASALRVLGNDLLPSPYDGTLTLQGVPTQGVAIVNGGGGAPAWIDYTPPADFSGTASLSYRYCTAAGACDDGDARVVVRPLVDPAIFTTVASGSRTFRITELRALPGARFEATPLVAPTALAFNNSVDPTRTSPWDSPAGVTFHTRTLAAPRIGETVTRILVDEPVGRVQEVLIGLDANGDGQPSLGEVGCQSAQGTARCELAVPRTAGQSLGYWVVIHNLRDAATNGTVFVYEVPGVPPDRSLLATGPGHVARGEDFDLRLGWVDDTLQDDGRRAGVVVVKATPDIELSAVPVFVHLDVSEPPLARQPVPLVEGRVHSFALLANELHRYTIIDVPAGATRLRVESGSAQNVNTYLVPMTNAEDAVETRIEAAPPISSARAQATGPSGNEMVEVSAGLLNPGRWYVVVHNYTTGPATYTLTASIDASAPDVRDGSYFNPDRSGSGVFLYPAGNQWTGLWYTYLADGTPTWYYLQALQPGADGLWTSPIWRSAWDGDSNTLTAVGDVTLTPNGADRFQMTYRLDGVTGSQPLESFGRGCPLSGTVNLSGTWFDPAHAGTGYSVQLFPNYEYYAAFVYDRQGIARFVAAELPTYGGSEAQLTLQQLTGACPTCLYPGAPVRRNIGFLTRRILSLQFQYITTDLEFLSPVSGEWTQNDSVQLLGGPGTTQGCTP